MATKRTTVNQLEKSKVQNETDKIHISKIDACIDILEALIPTSDTFSESQKYTSALDEIDRRIVTQKLLELVKKL